MRIRTILFAGVPLAVLSAIGYQLLRTPAPLPASHSDDAYLAAIRPPPELDGAPGAASGRTPPADRQTPQAAPRTNRWALARAQADEQSDEPKPTAPERAPSTPPAAARPTEPPAVATPDPDATAPTPALDSQAEEAEPASASAPSTGEPRPARGDIPSYRIRAGDTLASIAVLHYGDASKWRLIARANPSVNPKQLRIGQVVTLPPAGSEPPPAPDPQAQGEVLATHTVAQGDSLYSLARHYYGNGARWPAIKAANPGLRGASLHELKLGSKLVIPVIAADDDGD